MSHHPAGTRPNSGPISLQEDNQQNSAKLVTGDRQLSTGRFGRLVFALALLIVAGWGSCAAEAQTLVSGWSQLSPASSPAQRFGAPLAYDPVHAQVVMFGGFSGGGDANDTWLWNGANWTQASPATSPTPRDGTAMAYDAAHGQIVLFGGQVGGPANWTNETWLWDGTNWTKAAPGTSPAARNVTAMAYDAAHGNVVMFGGSVGGSRGGDTWVWNGTTWTQKTPAHSPPARDDYAMVYDAARGQVVIFGGEGASLNLLGDTWVWDGSDWTQKNPGSSPPARRGEGMAYDSTLGQVVMFGGQVSGGYLNDTWEWDGANWTQQTTANSPTGRDLLNGFTYDMARGQVVMFGGYGGTQLGDTWTFGRSQNFGNINVCPVSASTPAPCSITVPLTYNVATTTDFGVAQVVTQGEAGLDFSLASSSCASVVNPGATCTVNVKFAPTVPGLRMGAVNLVDSFNNLLVSTPVYGNGQAPAVTFDPASQTTVGTGIVSPYSIAFDAAGNAFVATWADKHVVKIAAGTGTQTTIYSGTGTLEGIAVDGAGNVYTADFDHNVVVEIPATGGAPIALGSGLNTPAGVAVDGFGNVFVADYQNNRVVKIPAGGGAQTTVGSGLSLPQGVAVDAQGDVFIVDTGNSRVVEVTPGGVQTTLPFTGLNTTSNPIGVAVDAAGDVFVVNYYGGQVFELTPSGVQTTVASLGGVLLVGVGVNAGGDVFILGNQIVKVQRSVPPSLSFTGSNLLFTSSDSPQTVTIHNSGNQRLLDSAINISSNFSQVPGVGPSPDCTVGFSLVPGASCNLSISFTPLLLGNVSGAAVLQDNALNSSIASQAIPLSGTGLGLAQQLSITGGGTGTGFVSSNPTGISCNVISGTGSGTCSVNFSFNQQVTLQEAPTNGSTFTGWGGACTSYGQSQQCVVTMSAAQNVTANFAPAALFALHVTVTGSGSGTVTSADTLINCGETNGTANPNNVCSANYSGSESLTATAGPGSVFLGWTSGCSGNSPNCGVTGPANVTAVFVRQSFGNVNVCPKGQNSPSPCSGTLSIPFTFLSSTSLGAIQVVTQGTVGLDFAQGNNNTCTGTIAPGGTCSVDVTFTPLAPGLRSGAITLYDQNGNQVATQAIYGVGQAPLAAFGPATVGVVSTTATYPLTVPNGVAVDAAGNLYIADVDGQGITGRVVKVGANGAVSTVGSGMRYPQGMAVDGAGNLFIADNNSNAVFEVTPAGVQTQMNFGLTAQLGVALDGAGNLFVGSFNGTVVKAPAGCTTAACTTLIYTAAPGLGVVGLATNAAGDLFVTSVSYPPGQISGQVVKVPAGCTNSSCQVPVGSGWSAPEAVAVDAAGNVVVAEEFPAAPSIIEVPAGCSSSACQITLSHVLAYGIAVDANGNVIIPDRDQNAVADPNSNKVIVLAGSHPPNPNFALTNVGLTSGDSPQSVSLQNVGNQPLTGSLALSGLGVNFAATGNCTSFALAPGAICSEDFSFIPQTTGYFTGNAAFSDNTLNLSAAVVRQQVNVTGIGGVNGVATTTAVPNVIGLTQAAAGTALTNAGLTAGSISTASSDVVPSGSVIASNPAAGTEVALTSAIKLQVSSGPGQAPSPNPLSLLNNYFVTGDYAAAGVNLHGTAAIGGRVTGLINIPGSSGPSTSGVPTGADLIDGFLYWTTLESSASPSGANATFLGYSISGQQIGKDLQNFADGSAHGTLRVYRANVNTYFQNGANGIRVGSGNFNVSLPGAGTNGVILSEGASLVVIYRVLSPNFPLKAVVIYDGAAIPPSSTTQNVQGFYDAAGGANASGAVTTLFVDPTGWNNSSTPSALGQPDHYNAPLTAGIAYGAVILSTAVNNPDNDGILGAWKAGPGASDFHSGEPGYYDVKTGLWVALPGAKAGQKDLFVQLDYMCGGLLSDGSCDPSKENFFPSPDVLGNDPLAMVQKAFANSGIALHLQVGNAIAEDTCVDSPGQPCQFPGQPGVVGWKNSLEFSKAWPRNLESCASGGDCSPRFAYGQKDSYHYVLFGHSLAIPAWNSRYGSLVSINAVAGGQTIITTTDRGTGSNKCPARITIAGIQGSPNLNGVYDTTSCSNSSTMTIATPSSVTTSWSYPNNNLPEPVIGITSGKATSISGYSDLGGADSAVTLGLWETATNQDMSKRANVIAGTLFHELGHTIGLGHGGLYYDQANYVPTFEANCKPNYQSIMNYMFQLDGVGQGGAIAFSNQTLTTLTQSSLASIGQLIDTGIPGGAAAAFPTSTWYVSSAPSSTANPATLHCDGTPLAGDIGYRVSGPIAPITPPWSNGQNITFDGQPYSTLRGFNDLANIDLRQVGATGGQFASLASVLSFGSSATALNIAPGGNVAVGRGGTVTLGAGGNITLGAGGNVTIPSGGSIAGGGTITFGTGGTVTLGAGGTIAAGSDGVIGVPGGGNITLGGGGTITLGGGGTVTLGAGGTVTLGAGGTITVGAGGSVIVPAGGSYTVPAGGTITLGSGGNVTLGAGGTVTLGGGGTVTLGAGGTVTLGGGGNVTLGAGGTVTMGGGGTVTLGGGGNVTLGAGGTITLGAGGNVTLGGGGNVTLGGGGTVTLGAGGDISIGSGGNVTLGAGGTVTLGAGGNITLGAGGNVTLGAGGTVTLGGGGNVTLGGGGTITLGGGGNITMNAAGTVTLGAGGTITGLGSVGPGTYPVSAGGTITLGAGGNVTLGAGGNVTLGAGGNITLGAGGNITLGGGGTITLGAGGTVTLGAGGNVTLGAGGNVTLGAGGNITLGAGGNITLGAGGNVTLGGGGATTTELDFDSANSIVRPPPTATYTIVPSAVRVDWTAPAFGVVQTYTISRSVNGGPTLVIGSVSGVNGNPPATTFFDTNPASGTVVYTIATTLVPDDGTNTQRQSPPSPPAVLTIDQTIALDPLPSSVSISTPTLLVAATALSSGTINNQLVTFTTTGPCSAGPSTIDTSNGKSSATVTLTNTGSCTITASQPGNSATLPLVPPAYGAADPVSGTFTIVSASSNVVAQTINFPQLGSVQYGSAAVPVSATASPSNFTVSFATSGPCNVISGNQIKINGAGACKVTASAPEGAGPNSTTYSAASLTQSFNIAPAPLSVIAGNLTVAYGQPIPSLTTDYTITGYVNGESSAVLNNTAPALATTATSTSAPGTYPITVSTGNLAATNYSFVYVSGTLTISQATPTISINNIPANAIYGGNFTPTYQYSGSGTPTKSTTSSSPLVCTVAPSGLVSFVGVGSCTLTASAAATTNYAQVTGTPQSFNVGKASQSITFNPTAVVTYGVAPFALLATSTSSLSVGLSIDGSSTAPASLSGNLLTITGAGSVIINANQTGNANYLPAQQVQRQIVVNQAPLTVAANNLSRVYGAANPALTVTYSGFVRNETLNSALSGAPSLSTTASATSLPGQYPITVAPGTLAARNYTFTFVNGILTVTATGSAPPSGTACNGVYTGTFKGNLTVSKGQTCILIGGGTTGSITGTGGNITLQAATIGSGVTIQGGGVFSIGPSTTIKGNLTVQSLPQATTLNQVCGSTITGSLVYQSNAAPVVIGNGTSACAMNTIGGSLQVSSDSAAVTMNGDKVSGSIQVQSNSGATTINGNTVGVSVQDQSNTGATQIFNNTIVNALQCQSNSVITGGGNKAAVKQGQCAKF